MKAVRKFRKIVAAGVLYLMLVVSVSTAAGPVPVALLTSVTSDTASQPIPTGNYRFCEIRVVAATTSVAVFTAYGSDRAGGTYDPFYQVINPASAGTIDNPQYFQGACPQFLYVATSSHSSGSITATLTMSGPK